MQKKTAGKMAAKAAVKTADIKAGAVTTEDKATETKAAVKEAAAKVEEKAAEVKEEVKKEVKEEKKVAANWQMRQKPRQRKL